MYVFKMLRRTVLALIASVFTLATQAQTYPNKPIRLVVPFAAGGSSDVLARLLAKEVEVSLGQPIVIESRVGAGGSVAAGFVDKSAPDGYTILLVAAGHAGMGALYDNLSFDPVKDFAPVMGLTTAPILLAVNADSSFKTIQELVAAAKSKPGKLNCAGGGGGATVTNLAFELLKAELGISITAVPYQGSAPAMTALLGNHIDCDSDAASSLVAMVQSGKLRALAVMSNRRIDLLPATPTVAETVRPGFSASIWAGLLAPKGTPAPVVERLHAEFKRALALPAVQDKLKAMASDPMDLGPVAFGEFLAKETTRWGGVIGQLGLKP